MQGFEKFKTKREPQLTDNESGEETFFVRIELLVLFGNTDEKTCYELIMVPTFNEDNYNGCVIFDRNSVSKTFTAICS